MNADFAFVDDMGGGHDLMDPVSHHDANGTTVAANRGRLRSIMADAGFEPYAYEWWHYSLRNEPYPDTYFDFPVTPVAPRGAVR